MGDPPPFYFEGFDAPQYTQVPDALFDVLLPELTESELKVLLYIIRRTFGFKKNSDTISLKQMVEGIRTRDGRQLDRGAGISKTSAVRGVNGLTDKGIIVVLRNRSVAKGDEPTTYQLRFKGDPVSKSDTRGSSNLDNEGGPDLVQAPEPDLDPQETVVQQRVKQQTDPSNYSRGLPKEEIERIAWTISDLAREFTDTAPAKSSATRAANLYERSGLDLDDFLDLVQVARIRTQRYTGSITSTNNQGKKTKMAYFFSVLESLLPSPAV